MLGQSNFKSKTDHRWPVFLFVHFPPMFDTKNGENYYIAIIAR
jgi:hypothetical protein